MTPRLFATLFVISSSLALAGKALDDAQTAFDNLAVDEAVPLFEKALEEPGTRDERAKAWKGLGLSRAFMADQKGAQTAFERLLAIDPEAKVDSSLGPRVTKPFELARKAMKGKRSTLQLERGSRDGKLTATLNEALPIASELRIYWRLPGAKAFTLAKGTSDWPLAVDTPPEKDVQAYAQALDAHGGVLFEDGGEAQARSFAAVVRVVEETRSTPTAVSSAVSDAKRKADGRRAADEELSSSSSDDEPTRWPLYVGSAVLVVAGGAAATYFFTRPPALALEPADRTRQLPLISF